jgi:hypothetical protein
VVSVPRDMPKKDRSSALDAVIRHERKHNGTPSSSQSTPRFSVSAKRSMNLDMIRSMHALYSFYLENGRDLEKAAVTYYERRAKWNERIKEKGWKRDRAFIPPFFKRYVEVVQKRAARVAAGSKRSSESSDKYNMYRQMVRRHLRQAMNIAENVGEGIFPGDF